MAGMALLASLLFSACGSSEEGSSAGESSASEELAEGDSASGLEEASGSESASESQADSSQDSAENEEAEIAGESAEEEEVIVPYDHTLCFAGDVSLADGSVPAQAYALYGLSGCFSDSLLTEMQEADLFCLNSEFAFTDGGTALSGKDYTYRSDPSRISILQEMGADVAVLANNHVFDYGEEGLLDTLETFRSADLPYVGAGEDLDEASAVHYAELGDCTVAYVAGTRVEWSELTRGADEDQSGVFRTTESNELICERIAEASENADFVVVYIHWGIENTASLESYQVDSGEEFIDAGADVVVGDHPHELQGIAWYDDKPIFYSMGNFWFSSYGKYTMLLEVEITRDESGEETAQYRLVPAWTENGQVTAITDESGQREFYDYMESLSSGVTIDDDGIVLQAE